MSELSFEQNFTIKIHPFIDLLEQQIKMFISGMIFYELISLNKW